MTQRLFLPIAILPAICGTPCCKPRQNPDEQKTAETGNTVPFPEARFVLVTSRNGLNLRTAPGIQSAKILTIPYGSTLPITEFGKKLEVIQERNGYWLKTEYSSKVGWIFSGYVIFGQTADKLKAYRQSLEEPPVIPAPAETKVLKADSDSNPDFLKTKAREQKLGNWLLTQYKYENKPGTYDCLATMAGVVFTRPGALPVELQAREIVDLNFRIPGVIPVFSDLGGCSCMQLKKLSLYYAGEAALNAIEFEMPLRREGNCGEGGGRDIETRYDKARDTIIQQTRAPLCPAAMPNSADAGQVGDGEPQFAGWAYTRYVVIRGLSAGKPDVKTMFALPGDLSKTWEAGAHLTSSRD